MKNSDNTIKQPDLETNQPAPAKPKTMMLYSDLTDNTPLTLSTDLSDTPASHPTTETYQIISEQFADNGAVINDWQPINASTPAVSDSNFKQDLAGNSQVTTTLRKEPKINALTDDKILQKSRQLRMTQDDRLEDDKMATGIAVAHMDVVLKQWYFTVQWQSTSMPKAGLYNKFKKRTQLMDLDLSCLLCNRYGEVIERVWFKNVRDKAESVRHRGDELVGKTPVSLADDSANANNQSSAVSDAKMNQESMVIYLNKLPPQVFHVVMVVSSYHGYALTNAKEALCQLSDDEGNIISDLAFSKLSNDTKALWFATLTRSADSWRYNSEHKPLGHTDIAMIEKEVSDNLVRTAR